MEHNDNIDAEDLRVGQVVTVWFDSKQGMTQYTGEVLGTRIYKNNPQLALDLGLGAIKCVYYHRIQSIRLEFVLRVSDEALL